MSIRPSDIRKLLTEMAEVEASGGRKRVVHRKRSLSRRSKHFRPKKVHMKRGAALVGGVCESCGQGIRHKRAPVHVRYKAAHPIKHKMAKRGSALVGGRVKSEWDMFLAEFRDANSGRYHKQSELMKDAGREYRMMKGR